MARDSLPGEPWGGLAHGLGIFRGVVGGTTADTPADAPTDSPADAGAVAGADAGAISGAVATADAVAHSATQSADHAPAVATDPRDGAAVQPAGLARHLALQQGQWLRAVARPRRRTPDQPAPSVDRELG